MTTSSHTYARGAAARLALEASGHGLAAVVEDEAEVDGEVERDAENVALDGGAEADGGLEVDKPLEEGAAWQRRGSTHLGLDETQHVGTNAQLQRVAGAPAERARRRRRRRRGRGRRRRSRGWASAVRRAGAGHAQHHQVHSEEECESLGRHCCSQVCQLIKALSSY
jgi:hypothetical protein